MKSCTSLFIVFLFSTTVSAAPMSRVVAVIDPQSVAVELNGVVTTVRLAGVEITDARNAFALLSWTLKDTWVLVENGMIYRSPDALLVNRELVVRGFARSTAPETSVIGNTRGVYLGEAAPGKAERSTARATESPNRTGKAAPASRPAKRPPRLMPRLIRRAKK